MPSAPSPISRARAPRHAAAAVCAALVFAAGCKREEPVGERTEPVPAHETSYPEPNLPKERSIFGAVAPHGGGENWIFFKLSGPTAEVEKQREAWEKFIGSLEYRPENERAPFFWKAPDEWHWKPGNEFRLATYKTGPIDPDTYEDPAAALAGAAAFRRWQAEYDANHAELSVSKARGTVLANINRWRDQVGLPPVPAVDLPRLMRMRDVRDATLIMVELSGPGPRASAAPMLPPFHPAVK